jgi:hypothetical protein
MSGKEMVQRSEVAELIAQERAGMLEELRDLVAQDVAFLARARSEGFDARNSVRLALTSEVSEDGRPTLAVQGGAEGLPDEIFPRLSAGYTVHYQAVVRSSAIADVERPELGVPSPIGGPLSAGGA